jgi:ABC-type nitrate/sulfonate/bicarbonate transport system permease component
MARAIDGMIVAELLLVAVGIGNLLLRYRAQFQGGLMFATVLVVALEASILISMMRAVERRLTRWL